MPQVDVLTHLFNAGEVSPAALNRVDKERIQLSAEEQINLFPYVIGKAIMRPGTQYLGATISTRSRLIPFARSIDARALLELGTNSGGDGMMRVYVDDEPVTRPAVTSALTNGDMSSATGWTVTEVGGASATFGAGVALNAPAQGGSVIIRQAVTTSSAGTEHALRIQVTRGEVLFRCGSSAGSDSYIRETTLGEGFHSLAFTPTGTYHVWFKSQSPNEVVVNSCLVESAGVMEIDADWDLDTLRSIRYSQSLDVVFCAMRGSRQFKIERRGSSTTDLRSWSVVDYYSNNGPFTLARTADVKLTPSATQGNITLSASASFFSSSHVGALFKLTHENVNATYRLAAAGEYTKTIRVVGIKPDSGNSDRNFDVITSGTWSGTLRIQRSFDSEFSGFEDIGSDITTNTTTSIDEDDDNAIVYYRVIMNAYTSGVAVINIQYDQDGGTGICRVTAFSSATSVSAEVLSDFRDVAATADWLEDEWSPLRGFPTAIAQFDGRLFFARDDRFWGSVSDSFYSFTTDTEGDSGSIQRNVAIDGTFSDIQWLLALQRLILGLEGAEASARSSNFDEPLTPTALTLKAASTYGAFNATPIRVDTRGIFLQLSGQDICEIYYDVEVQDYVASSLLRLHEQLYESSAPGTYDDGFVELAVQRQPETYVWAVRDDGVCCILIYEPKEKVAGWIRMISGHITNLEETVAADRIISVTVLPGQIEDDVYFVVQRTLSDGEGGGDTGYFYIEKLRHHREVIQRTFNTTTRKVTRSAGPYLADSFITATGTSTAGQTITGLDHLEGCAVIVIGQVVGGAYGPDGTTYTVSSGAISLTNAMSGTLVIGRPYYGQYKSAKLAFGIPNGTALTQPKTVQRVGMAFLDTDLRGIKVGPSFDDLFPLPQTKSDFSRIDPLNAFAATYEETLNDFAGSWSPDSRVCLQVEPGYAAGLSGLIMEVDANPQ
jgi:hypothetical protein